MRNIAILVVLLFTYAEGVGQSADQQALKESMLKLETFKLFDKLVQNSRVKNEIEEFRFRDLYATEDAIIVNEVLPSNEIDKPVSVSEYLTMMIQYEMGGTMNVYTFRPYDIHILDTSSDGKINLSVDAMKVVGLLSVENIFYKDSLDLNYEIVYNPADQEMRIRKVSLNKPVGKFWRLKLDEKLAQDGNFDGEILVNGRGMSLEGQQDLILNGIQEDGYYEVVPKSEDYLGGLRMKVGPQKLEPHGRMNNELTVLSFRPKKFYISGAYGMGGFDDNFSGSTSGQAFPVSGNVEISDIRLRLGYRFLKSGAFYMSAFAGPGMRSYSSTYEMPDYASNYASEDEDGDSYSHISKLNGLQESNSIRSIYIRVGLNSNYQLSRLLDLGVSASYQIPISSHGTYSIDAVGSYHGYYPDWDLRIYNVDDYGFVSDEAVAGSGDLGLNDSSGWLEVEGALGFRVSRRFKVLMGGAYNSQPSLFLRQEELNSLSPTYEELNSIQVIGEERTWSYFLFRAGVKIFI